MRLKDMACHLPEEIWALFEPILPASTPCATDGWRGFLENVFTIF